MMNRVLIILSMLRIFVKNGKTALMWKLFQRMTGRTSEANIRIW
ncbi:hypothetical protein F7P07_00530 [Klebsiella pneumoniae]|nr:hypothetical protein F7P07_00530 [Klebsiella pneumoniae]